MTRFSVNVRAFRCLALLAVLFTAGAGAVRGAEPGKPTPTGGMGGAGNGPVPTQTPPPKPEVYPPISLTNVTQHFAWIAGQLKAPPNTLEFIRYGNSLIVIGDHAAQEYARAVVAAARTRTPEEAQGSRRIAVLVPLEYMTPRDAKALIDGGLPGVQLTSVLRESVTEFTDLPRSYRETNTVILTPSKEEKSLEERARAEKARARNQAERAAAERTLLQPESVPTTSEIPLEGVYQYNQFKAKPGVKGLTRDRNLRQIAHVWVVGPEADVINALQAIDRQDSAEPQVLVDVRVLEMSPSAVDVVGAQWSRNVNGLLTNTRITESRPTDVGRFGRFTRSGFEFNPVVLGLISRGEIKVRANPSVTITNGDAAEIFLGDNLTFANISNLNSDPLVSETSTINTKVGIQLFVAPVVQGETVDLKVIASVGNLSPEPGRPEDTTLFFSQFRRAETNLRLPDNGMTAIAGLVNDSEIRRTERIPVLGDLPLLGKLFTARRTARRTTEFTVLIGTRIIRGSVSSEPLFQPQPVRLHLEQSELGKDGSLQVTGRVMLDGPVPASAKKHEVLVTVEIPGGLNQSLEASVPDGQRVVPFQIHLPGPFKGPIKGKVLAEFNSGKLETTFSAGK